jgi:hypothetical protein
MAHEEERLIKLIKIIQHRVDIPAIAAPALSGARRHTHYNPAGLDPNFPARLEQALTALSMSYTSPDLMVEELPMTHPSRNKPGYLITRIIPDNNTPGEFFTLVIRAHANGSMIDRIAFVSGANRAIITTGISRNYTSNDWLSRITSGTDVMFDGDHKYIDILNSPDHYLVFAGAIAKRSAALAKGYIASLRKYRELRRSR